MSPWLLLASTNEVIHTVAHELAHIYCHAAVPGHQWDPHAERDANAKAKEWGFLPRSRRQHKYNWPAELTDAYRREVLEMEEARRNAL